MRFRIKRTSNPRVESRVLHAADGLLIMSFRWPILKSMINCWSRHWPGIIRSSTWLMMRTRCHSFAPYWIPHIPLIQIDADELRQRSLVRKVAQARLRRLVTHLEDVFSEVEWSQVYLQGHRILLLLITSIALSIVSCQSGHFTYVFLPLYRLMYKMNERLICFYKWCYWFILSIKFYLF